MTLCLMSVQVLQAGGDIDVADKSSSKASASETEFTAHCHAAPARMWKSRVIW